MKTGDLVRSTTPGNMKTWIGIIIGWDGCDPIVFWNMEFSEEIEYTEQLEVINECR